MPVVAVSLKKKTEMTVWAWRGKFAGDYYRRIEITGIYCHFVDIVLIFLFPLLYLISVAFFFSSRRRHTRFSRDWSSDVCSSDLVAHPGAVSGRAAARPWSAA